MIRQTQKVKLPVSHTEEFRPGNDDVHCVMLAGCNYEEAEHDHRQPGNPLYPPVDIPNFPTMRSWSIALQKDIAISYELK